MNKITIKVRQPHKAQKISVKHKSLTRYAGVRVETGTNEYKIRNILYGEK